MKQLPELPKAIEKAAAYVCLAGVMVAAMGLNWPVVVAIALAILLCA
jgi:hypothetical protein